jgi:hypothetical protein
MEEDDDDLMDIEDRELLNHTLRNSNNSPAISLRKFIPPVRQPQGVVYTSKRTSDGVSSYITTEATRIVSSDDNTCYLK